jgi:epsilon-lactone hydrolase
MKIIESLPIFGLSLIAASAAAGTPPSSARQVPAYDLPTPSTVSPQLQDVIASTRTSAAPREVATTNAGWEALFGAESKMLRTENVKLLAHFKLTMTEENIAGVHCYVVNPNVGAPRNRLLMHIHGGGYVGGAGEVGANEAILVAGSTGIKTITVDYRMPPDHPFPAPVDDALAVWKHISQNSKNMKLGLFGSSTGGAMVMAVTQRAIAEHLRVPDALFAGTPWSDLSETGDSYFTNRHADLMMYDGELGVMAKQYANGLNLKDPRLSPVYGSFVGFPPTLLISGTRDLFLSNTVRVDQKLREAGVKHELIVYEGQQHASFLSGIEVPETLTAMKDISAFFDRELK